MLCPVGLQSESQWYHSAWLSTLPRPLSKLVAALCFVFKSIYLESISQLLVSLRTGFGKKLGYLIKCVNVIIRPGNIFSVFQHKPKSSLALGVSLLKCGKLGRGGGDYLNAIAEMQTNVLF